MLKLKQKKYWQLYLLMLPAFVYILIFSYVPMYGIIIAFKDYKATLGYLGSEWVGLKHFVRFVTYPGFWNLLRNTLSISLYSLATFPCAVILAVLINEINGTYFKKTVQMITYAPHFLSTVVMCGLIVLIVGRDGFLGHLYQLFSGERQDLLTIPGYFSSIYVWSDVWQNTGWGTIIYLAALAGVPAELVESAKIDGASRLQIILHINIPYIMPTIIIMLIMRMGSILSVGFDKIFLLQNDLNLEASAVIASYVYNIGLMGGQFSYSSAIGLFNNVVNVIMILVVNMIAKKVSGIGVW